MNESNKGKQCIKVPHNLNCTPKDCGVMTCEYAEDVPPNYLKKKNPDYKHKEGGDNLVSLPEGLEYLSEHGFKAYRYRNSVFLRGPGYDTKVIDELLKKINNQESLVIVITGGPGTGKTYLGIALARILDPDFQCTDTPPPDPKEDTGQIPFDRVHLMFLTGENSPLKRGQVILPDESHFGIGARGWQRRDQQDLTNYIAAIRSKGYVLILIVLHTEMIDKLVRDFVINYEIRVTNKGEGIVYRRWFPQFGKEVYKKRIGKIKLPLPDSHLCSYKTCLGCRHLNPKKDAKRCVTIRAIYERRKEHFLNLQSRQDEEEGFKSTYHEASDVIEAISGVQDQIPRKKVRVNKDGKPLEARGKILKGPCVTWLKQMGIKHRHADWAALIRKIENTYG